MGYYASDISRILGIKRTRLQRWLEYGFHIPSLQKADGSGTRNVYSLGDVYSIAVFQRLLDIGMRREQAAVFIRGIDFEDACKKGAMALELSGVVDEHSKTLSVMEMKVLDSTDQVALHMLNPKYADAVYADFVTFINLYKIFKEVDAKL